MRFKHKQTDQSVLSMFGRVVPLEWYRYRKNENILFSFGAREIHCLTFNEKAEKQRMHLKREHLTMTVFSMFGCKVPL